MIYGLFYKSPLGHKLHSQLQTTDLASNTWFNDECYLSQSSVIDSTPKVVTSGTPPNLAIVAWVRLYNKDELADKLGINSRDRANITPSELILDAYLRFGEQCTAHLLGDFCFAIYDIRQKSIFCARDHMGVRPFYFYNDEHIFAFASSMSFFHKLKPLVPIKPCMEWTSKFMISNLSMDFRKTAYQNIFKLPPAHQLSVSAKTITEERYFEFNTNKISLSSSKEYVEYYHSFLDTAVKSRVQLDHPLGSEISGGIDSSTVTAYAALHYPRPLSDLHTFGFAMLDKEPHHILQVNQHLGIPMGHICCNESLFKHDHTRELEALGAPVEHGNATYHEIFYALAAKHNVKTLLSGFGGDEFVTSIHGYLYLNELLKDKKYFKLYQNFKGNAFTRLLRLAKFLCYKTDSNAGLKNLVMANAYAARYPYHVVNDELINTYNIKALYAKAGQFDYGYNNLDKFTLENRFAPFVSTRMENCTLMAQSYGIEYSWPLLDVRLIQAFLSIPSSEKYHQGMGRYLHRRAIAKVVPKAITGQNSKYMGERVNNKFSRQIVKLNDDLHPDLSAVININKIRQQEKELTAIISADFDYTKPLVFSAQRNIQNINQLDYWLKYYFPNGCSWANTPNDLISK